MVAEWLDPIFMPVHAYANRALHGVMVAIPNHGCNPKSWLESQIYWTDHSLASPDFCDDNKHCFIRYLKVVTVIVASEFLFDPGIM